MTKPMQQQILEIFAKHLEQATEEIAENVSVDFFWTPNANLQLAELCTTAVVMLQEAEEERVANEA